MAPPNKSMANVPGDESDSDTELVLGDADDAREHADGNSPPAEYDEDMTDGETDGDGGETRRQEALEQMGRIEKEFSELKDRLYREKLHSVDVEIDQIAAGEHAEFVESIQLLEKKKEERLRMAEMWRSCQLDVIEAAYTMERVGADTDYNGEVQNVRERMITTLQDKKKRLEEEKGSIDVPTELASDYNGRLAPLRKLRRRGGIEPMDTKSAKKRVAAGPHLLYQLKENEILEDLYIVNKANPAVATRRAAAVAKDAREKELDDVTYDNNSIVYQGNRYERGSSIFIESREAGRYNGSITAVNNSEILVRRTDGSKTKIALQQLRQGKTTIRPRT